MKLHTITIVCIAMILCISGWAEQVKWIGGGADDFWSTSANWENSKVPGSYDVVFLNPPPGRGPVINTDIECGEIRGPVWKSWEPQVVDVIGCNVKVNGWWRWANRGSGQATINIDRANVDIGGMFRLSDSGHTYGVANITDSVVKCKGILIGDGGNGEINLKGNVFFEVEESVNMGGSSGDDSRSYEDKPLRITMDGGIFRIGKTLMCPSDKDRAGTASIQIKAGTLICKEFTHADVPYLMDIEEGMFVVAGNVASELEKDIASGYITAFGGKFEVICKYRQKSDRTVVTAKTRHKARRPFPRNRAEDVKPDETLKWRAGRGEKKYNLYFGKSLNDVGSAANAYEQVLTNNSFVPKMEFGTTYYWRVDTIDQAGTLHRGVSWQFTTTDGRAADPVPADEAKGVLSNAVLNWKAGLSAASNKVYMGTDPEKLVVVYEGDSNSFKPQTLELGRKYYWRVDGYNQQWTQSPWAGQIWSFNVDSGKAENPEPMDKAQWQPNKVTLSWLPAKTATAHNVYISDKYDDVVNPVSILSKGRKENTYTIDSLAEATTYYWRVDEVCRGRVVKGDIWQFSTEGILDLKVDLAVPQWQDRSKPREGTAKPGWITWCSERWADMYMHDGVWFPSKSGSDSVLGSGVRFFLDNGKGGNGAVMAKGICRGGLAGDLPPYGKAEGDPIANTYFYSCDWAGQKNGDAFLMIRGLPAGQYQFISYHNHWEPCTQQTRNCHMCESGMPPMPSVSANPVPAKALEGYGAWTLPAGTGKGVKAIESAYNVKVSSVLSDQQVTRSKIRFETDGSDVLIIYEAPDNSYPDRARKGREGARGIFNAFELKLVKWIR